MNTNLKTLIPQKDLEILEKILTDKSVQYHGLHRTIDWSLWSQKELFDLIIEHPEQTLIRFHIIENEFFRSQTYIEKLLLVYSKKECQTFDSIIRTCAPSRINLDIILQEFYERAIGRCSMYNLSEINLILDKYKYQLSKDKSTLDRLLKLQKTYQLSEKSRHANYRGDNMGRH